jgi:hypothetical protein
LCTDRTALGGKKERQKKKRKNGTHGGSARRWENIKMDIKVAGCENVNWIYLIQDRDTRQTVVNTVRTS